MKKAKLREMIEAGELIEAPGVYDALTARIVEAHGFKAVYMTGYGTAATLFAYPDIGLLTMTEMVDASRIADAVSIPLIADADTGYGNPVNVTRTVKEYEKAGVAAIHIEDQVWPKKCGHMAGKKVIPASDMVGKIRAAVDTRKDRNFLIIARTDALATDGFDQAIERSLLYAEAGADILFVDAPVNRDQMEKIPRLLAPNPVLINLGPATPNFSGQELKEMGYAVVLYQAVCFTGAIKGCVEEVKRLKETGRQRDFENFMESFSKFNKFLHLQYYSDLEEKYKRMAREDRKNCKPRRSR